ncbi:MAG: type II toxin-antitoxin system PemK/MazF family toxin [Synergistaceae bacterium]|nr:type II toxin-antitoxin system PemK/MazF family toxin [Synergistaceae bacterium]
MRKYSQGEIIEIVFPYEDGIGSKRRPALVIQDVGDSVIVAKITSKHKGLKWDIELPQDAFNGLSVDSVVQVDKIRLLNKSELCSIIPRGNINPIQLAIIKGKIKEYKNTK